MDKYGLGNFLAELRNEKGLTQEQLAEMINVNYKTISKWECGNSTPSLDTLVRLCEIYDVSLYEMSIYKRIKNPLISKNNIKKIINKQSITKYIILKIAFTIFLASLITFATYSGIYTINNYNQMKIYELVSEDNNIEINGLFVKTHSDYYLTITKFKYLNENDEFLKNKTTKLNYSIIINNKLVEDNSISFDTKTNVFDAISLIRIFAHDKNINCNISTIELRINYFTDKIVEKTKVFKIRPSVKHSNNKLFY